ncbi:hypothetical protein [Salinisphaera sp. LB1]|uniref:hypothetical protein n=1 Tax=Salinisphaera sp. LB1 TaxID=2183911 RepID=UPI000E75EBED|nr:hypothetical protein [Salinisphaera sp. LB1]
MRLFAFDFGEALAIGGDPAALFSQTFDRLAGFAQRRVVAEGGDFGIDVLDLVFNGCDRGIGRFDRLFGLLEGRARFGVQGGCFAETGQLGLDFAIPTDRGGHAPDAFELLQLMAQPAALFGQFLVARFGGLEGFAFAAPVADRDLVLADIGLGGLQPSFGLIVASVLRGVG